MHEHSQPNPSDARISRRSFLKRFALMSGGLALSAVGGIPPPPGHTAAPEVATAERNKITSPSDATKLGDVSAEVDNPPDEVKFNKISELPEPLEFPTATIYGDELYVIGGFGATTLNKKIYRANIRDMANFQWSSTSAALPTGVFMNALERVNREVYLMGGFIMNPDGTCVSTKKTLHGTIGTNGDVGAWEENAEIPESLVSPTSLSINGEVYILCSDRAYKARKSGSRVIGWDASFTYPGKITSGAVTTLGNRIFVTGPALEDIYSMQLNSDGSVTPWLPQLAPSGALGKQAPNLISHDNSIFIVAGFNAITSTKPIYRGQLDAKNNTLLWKRVGNLDTAFAAAASTVCGNNLLLIGGDDKDPIFEGDVKVLKDVRLAKIAPASRNSTQLNL